jgi:hypothetical protein
VMRCYKCGQKTAVRDGEADDGRPKYRCQNEACADTWTKGGPRKTREPQDRLTRICDGMLAAFNQHDEKQVRDRAIVFLVDEQKGGIGIAGYDDDADALADLMVHLRVIFRARGQDLHFVPVGTTPPKERV